MWTIKKRRLQAMEEDYSLKKDPFAKGVVRDITEIVNGKKLLLLLKYLSSRYFVLLGQIEAWNIFHMVLNFWSHLSFFLYLIHRLKPLDGQILIFLGNRLLFDLHKDKLLNLGEDIFTIFFIFWVFLHQLAVLFHQSLIFSDQLFTFFLQHGLLSFNFHQLI